MAQKLAKANPGRAKTFLWANGQQMTPATARWMGETGAHIPFSVLYAENTVQTTIRVIPLQ
jgi:hypothetical protein